MRKDDKLIFYMLRKDESCFMLNQGAGTPVKPRDYESIRLYWGRRIYTNQRAIEEPWYGVSELEHRDYGQTEFVLTNDDGYSHCFGVPTQDRHLQATESIRRDRGRAGERLVKP